MNTFFSKTILFIAFIIVSIGNVHAEGISDVTKSMGDFEFENVIQKTSGSEPEPESDNESSSQEQDDEMTLQLALINNNQNYVLITASLFAFTLLIITFLMKITPHQPKDIVTIVGLVSVIFGTILLVLVVDTTETLTAPMGILGAIAGYLFASAQKREVAEG